MTPKVFSYGYHTVVCWAYSLEALEADRRELIANWGYKHSPAEAVSYIAEVPLSEVESDWFYVGAQS